METLLKKLNYKNEKEVLMINIPEEFEDLKEEFSKKALLIQNIEILQKIDYCLVFVKSREEIDRIVPEIAVKLGDDPKIWFAYPKKSSKKYQSLISRDTGWEMMKQYVLRPVRQVSLNEDWSSLRFRKAELVSGKRRR